ncbi:uncharacterized protein LOC141628795 [Silene latifolia]|uniref:uncharacterized protein LOC141628795 n=1 Tax=Silene latifolia TaxID=37657 RepID=UPI003D777AF7
MSPVRHIKAPRQGGNVSTDNLSSPTYKEVVSGISSPKTGIDLSVTNVITQQKFYCTLVYAFNEVSDREDLWLNLKRIADSLVGPWAVGGDFNCGLSILGTTSSHLRQGFAVDWTECFFDHTLCVVGKTKSSTSKNRPFKYYNMWSKAPELKECVFSIWEQCLRGTKMYRVTRKLKLLKPHLKLLNRSLFSDMENKVDLAHTDLIDIQKQLIHNHGDEELVRKEILANKDFVWLHQARMEFLKQKAKAHWMTDGDGNSSYFHGLLKSRRNHNGIQQAILKYYQLLLGSKNSSNNVIDAVVKKGRTCSEAHVLMLMQPIRQAEIKEVMFHIPNDKAPGPDGYSSKFFKDTWDIIGEEVSEAISDFFHSGQLLKQLNATLITLIPKVARPSTVLEFRPIACCNVLYKCISKILCNSSSGLKMSKGKSNVYFNGVPAGLKNQILQVSGLIEGKLPFRYLGVPIKTTRLTSKDCKPLIDKIVNRIRSIGAKKLSYAGRNFLWDGGVDFMRSPLVAWEKVCKPKREGGVRLKQDSLWNMAVVAMESVEHLFFACSYSRAVLLQVRNWISISLPTQDILNWRLARSGTKLQLDILNATINACLYHIWRQRNLSKHELTLIRLARLIIQEIQLRIRGENWRNNKHPDVIWIEKILEGRG